jgi:hypothetical protein
VIIEANTWPQCQGPVSTITGSGSDLAALLARNERDYQRLGEPEPATHAELDRRVAADPTLPFTWNHADIGVMYTGLHGSLYLCSRGLQGAVAWVEVRDGQPVLYLQDSGGMVTEARYDADPQDDLLVGSCGHGADGVAVPRRRRHPGAGGRHRPEGAGHQRRYVADGTRHPGRLPVPAGALVDPGRPAGRVHRRRRHTVTVAGTHRRVGHRRMPLVRPALAPGAGP